MLLALRCGKIARMAEPAQDPALLLREDLSKEYYAALNVVSNYDGWLLIVKGWSVTLSLARWVSGSSRSISHCSPSPR
jgi:hypothetical protein